MAKVYHASYTLIDSSPPIPNVQDYRYAWKDSWNNLAIYDLDLDMFFVINQSISQSVNSQYLHKSNNNNRTYSIENQTKEVGMNTLWCPPS